MDNRHFDALTRALAGVSRRSALALSAAAVAGLVSGQGTDANNRRDRKFRRRMKRRHRRFKRRNRNSGSAPGAQTCEGSSGCGAEFCPNSGAGCYCRIESGTDASICTGGAAEVLNCAQCEPTQVCIDLSACIGPGAVGCAVKCGS